MKTLTIIDTFGFFFRLYYAMSGLRTRDGKPSGMVHGFANFIDSLKSELESDYIIFALDSKGKTFRSQIDPNYKMNRQTPPPALLEQLPVCIDMIKQMELCAVEKEGYEADDIIASLVKNYKDKFEIRIVTHDKDLYQLISENVSIYSPAKKELYDKDGCFEKYGVYPEQIRDFLAIVGDSADNIPGVKGIGEKGAKKLLDEFGNLEQIYENLDKILNNRTKSMLIDGKDSAFLSKKLTTLYEYLEIPKLDGAKFPDKNPLLKITQTLKDYNLSRLLASLNVTSQNSELNFEPILVNDDEKLLEILKNIDSKTLIAFDTETTGIDSKTAKIVGFSFCFDKSRSYYAPINHSFLGVSKQISPKVAKEAIEKIFSTKLVGHNLKYDFAIVKNSFDINPPKIYADTMIMAWLLDPQSSVGMDNLANRLYGYKTIKFENIVKKSETFASVNFENATKYASEDAWITLRFYHTLSNVLDPEILKLGFNLEFPFIKVLLDMESEGIGMDINALKNLSQRLDLEIKQLTNEIYDLSGERFNINSPKQLGEVLFDKLNLPSKKKTKTGYSTNETVLNELIDAHPVITKILDYREVYKLKSTYADPLLKLAMQDKNSRVYTNFLQTGTATGRLSSKNPNLQNIPARGRLADDVRACFVSREGFSFISLDYSQIELRLLAHFSKDPALLKAFKDGADIHERTAISIFGSSDKDKRAIAKSINFGLIYGMGSTKLASELQISRNEAKDYIDRYFKAFTTIKEFLNSLKDEAKSKGYATTLFGRRRLFDFANATPMQYAAYEREAVNTKFQGSAADIIKKAMLEISPLLDEDRHLLLQIHDELIFEVKDEFVDSFVKLAKEKMENVVKLNVPLIASVSTAKNWANLKG
ncbi:DNA polymerase I [Campylobacter corcagiensis]|uniref:DNA polymerase I n=1 Tax=Campylobacter corcagiensis TaxID=1448857 RepID=A0A7M1LE58_9BACT|nr:DNA polymerase I [Campylobacter corcagiensis]QKF65264.1 DNA polymerase I, 5' -- 3' polymerase, 5' -- 3' and 3' -- 5' exonuclease [Campylobacter corcagiensis]QOQ86603.1 DNA polymerase I [Campylobacter corcagiensis]